MVKPVVIGVAGGSGSGKTTVAREILRRFQNNSAVLLEQDAYYKDLKHLPIEERRVMNFDHPLAFDNDLLLEQLHQLIKRRPVRKPVYDYKNHARSDKTVFVTPKDVIVVEGILVLEDERLRELMDIKVFVDTDPDVRILRRLVRDIRHRGRTMESVIEQYMRVVRPMHLQFVEPTKRYADVIIPEGGRNPVAIDLVVSKVKTTLEERTRRSRTGTSLTKQTGKRLALKKNKNQTNGK